MANDGGVSGEAEPVAGAEAGNDPDQAEDMTDPGADDGGLAEDRADADATAESNGDGPGPAGDEDEVIEIADLEQEGEIAADYSEGLPDIADLGGALGMHCEGNRAVV